MPDSPPKRHKTRPNASDRAAIAQALPAENKPALIQNLKRYLADLSPKVRCFALDKVRDEKLLELEGDVLLMLSDKNQMVRYSAADCIGFLYAEKCIEATWLYPLLNDPYDLVRIEALESLAQIGDRASLPLIAKRLEDTAPLVRAYAATAIEDLDGEDYIQAIENALRIETADRAKVSYASALFYFGDEKQFQTLLSFLSSTDYQVRCAAANTIGAFKLDSDQMKPAVERIEYAQKNFLYRADQSTMARVLAELHHDQKQLASD